MWECYCDLAYYDMWAVRYSTNKDFNSVIHVMTEKEAKFLVEELNELQNLRKININRVEKEHNN